MKKDFINWLIGFLDAEGNFQVFPKVQKNKEGLITRYGIGVGFHIGLHIRDIAILELIKIELGERVRAGKFMNMRKKRKHTMLLLKKKSFESLFVNYLKRIINY